MHWKLKALAQHFLSLMPYREKLYLAGQRYFGGLRSLKTVSGVASATSLLKAIESAGESVQGTTTLEIGTGWTAVVPLSFWLHGQQTCHTYDLHRWLVPSNFRRLLRELVEWLDAEAPRPGIAPGRVAALREAVTTVQDLGMLEKLFGIHYHAPGDATRTRLPDASVDMVFSRYVLGHIPLPVLEGFACESLRVLKPGGLFVHIVDLGDQHSHSQGHLSPVNFLRYSSDEFRKYNCYFLYQNRLRASQLRNLVERFGFRILHWNGTISPRALATLPQLQIADEFAGLSPEDLCTTVVRFTARKPGHCAAISGCKPTAG